MSAPHRRRACPGLAHPMATGDGFLARLIPSGRTITLDAWSALSAAARTHGNGIVEITARGSIQLRGLRSETIDPFANAVGALGIATDGVPVITDPLTGLDAMTDLSALAHDLRVQLSGLPFAAGLAPKVSVVIDAGTVLHLDHLAADIRFRVEQTPDGEWAHMMLGGDADSATPLGAVPLPEAIDRTVRVLEIISGLGSDARARDLLRENRLDAVRAQLGRFVDRRGPAPRPLAEPVRVCRLRDGTIALGLGLAFGSTDVDALDGLIDAARALGAVGLRTAYRALLVIGLPDEAVMRLSAAAEDLGFVTRADDPRRYIAACAGAPICASAHFAARAVAPAIAQAAGRLLDNSFVLHLSGCAKGCAHPGRSALTIVGHGRSCDVVIDGSAADRPTGGVPAEALASHLAELADRISEARRIGESSADALRRLGNTVLAHAERGHG